MAGFEVQGCRQLLLLHDQQGHPLLATTHRSDLHLTAGVPALVRAYERASTLPRLTRLVIDREGLAAEFLATLAAAGCTVVTVLRADQYTGLASFTDVGPFVPLPVDRDGQVARDVAPARFRLSRPAHPEAPLALCVALVRDHRRQVPTPHAEGEAAAGDDWCERQDPLPLNWADDDWEATSLPAQPTQPKLIPIVTTAAEADPVELVRAYTGRCESDPERLPLSARAAAPALRSHQEARRPPQIGIRQSSRRSRHRG